MAADKKAPMIVIKKIQAGGHGHHGGAWKVALADFMTAMMAFFLVMWLTSQSEEVKKAVSDYFSTPSVIEYNFSNYGVEVTLEKLFLDLVNEPLKAVQSILQPMDTSPNVLDFGTKSVQVAYIMDQLQDIAKNLQAGPEGIEFDIPDNLVFEAGTAQPKAEFVDIMEKVKGITVGLEHSRIEIASRIFNQSVPGGSKKVAQAVAAERLSMVKKKVEVSLESPTVDVTGRVQTSDKRSGTFEPNTPQGFIHFKITNKPDMTKELKPRVLEDALGETTDMGSYDQFVDELAKDRAHKE